MEKKNNKNYEIILNFEYKHVDMEKSISNIVSFVSYNVFDKHQDFNLLLKKIRKETSRFIDIHDNIDDILEFAFTIEIKSNNIELITNTNFVNQISDKLMYLINILINGNFVKQTIKDNIEIKYNISKKSIIFYPYKHKILYRSTTPSINKFNFYCKLPLFIKYIADDIKLYLDNFDVNSFYKIIKLNPRDIIEFVLSIDEDWKMNIPFNEHVKNYLAQIMPNNNINVKLLKIDNNDLLVYCDKEEAENENI